MLRFLFQSTAWLHQSASDMSGNNSFVSPFLSGINWISLSDGFSKITPEQYRLWILYSKLASSYSFWNSKNVSLFIDQKPDATLANFWNPTHTKFVVTPERNTKHHIWFSGIHHISSTLGTWFRFSAPCKKFKSIFRSCLYLTETDNKTQKIWTELIWDSYCI